MSFASVFMGTSFVLEILLTLYYFWTANEMPETNNTNIEGKKQTLTSMFSGWKKSLMIFAVSLLLFFIYYGSLMVSLIGSTATYNNLTVITNQDWRLGYQFLTIMTGLMMINLGVLAWRTLRQTELLFMVFGGNTKSRKWKQV